MKTKSKLDEVQKQALQKYDNYQRSLEQNNYFGVLHNLICFIFEKIIYLFKYVLFLNDKLIRKIEFSFYFTFILKKKEELKEKVNTCTKDRNNQKGIELSFSEDKKRDISEYNEAGFFVNPEKEVLFVLFKLILNYNNFLAVKKIKFL